jgi:hypothetical protein
LVKGDAVEEEEALEDAWEDTAGFTGITFSFGRSISGQSLSEDVAKETNNGREIRSGLVQGSFRARSGLVQGGRIEAPVASRTPFALPL